MHYYIKFCVGYVRTPELVEYLLPYVKLDCGFSAGRKFNELAAGKQNRVSECGTTEF